MFSTVKSAAGDLIHLPPVKDLVNIPPGQGLFNLAEMDFYTNVPSSWYIRVEGHDTGLPADNIRKALKDHFRSCGTIAKIEIHDSYALVLIFGDGADEKALELNGSELRGCKLVVKSEPVPELKIATTGLSFGGNPGT
ncbi:Nucleolin 1 [Cardamine amara subsp. amara]|uniref:Nucleolin 1 n=1 Tax=Cardamine amara subsp. amara TaxID=228776 RepID=A0ABD1BIJ7_CARAN